jgi:DNA segregation ATPase FtsK/SpoIIIE, S-DNA-T family
VKIDGLRADDLAGTGLATKQRWAMPLPLGITLAAVAFAYRRVLRLAAVLARCWRGSVPAALLSAGYLRHGELGFAVVLAVLATIAGVWWWRSPTSFARHVVQRAYGAVRWHTVYRRRWPTALDACGLAWVSRDRVLFVPRVTAVHSTRVVDVLDVRLLHGQTPEQVGEQAEALRHVFGAHRCKVNETAPGRVRITFYARDPLTAPLPPIPPQPSPDLRALPVGLSEDGTVFCLRLLGRHTLVAGASGAGKGSALWSPIQAVAPLIRAGVVELHGIDPKRMELVFAPELFTKMTAGTPADAAGHLEELTARMTARQDRLAGKAREHTATPDDPAVVLVVDELAALTAYCTDKDAKRRFEAALSLLLSQGRAVGFYVVAALQDPRKEVVAFRDLFTTRIALRTTEASHADMILGDGALDRGAACHRIPDSLPGVGYVYVEGTAEPVRVRFTYLTDPDIRDLATSYAPGVDQPTADAAPVTAIGEGWAAA